MVTRWDAARFGVRVPKTAPRQAAAGRPQAQSQTDRLQVLQESGRMLNGEGRTTGTALYLSLDSLRRGLKYNCITINSDYVCVCEYFRIPMN